MGGTTFEKRAQNRNLLCSGCTLSVFRIEWINREDRRKEMIDWFFMAHSTSQSLFESNESFISITQKLFRRDGWRTLSSSVRRNWSRYQFWYLRLFCFLCPENEGYWKTRPDVTGSSGNLICKFQNGDFSFLMCERTIRKSQCCGSLTTWWNAIEYQTCTQLLFADATY